MEFPPPPAELPEIQHDRWRRAVAKIEFFAGASVLEAAEICGRENGYVWTYRLRWTEDGYRDNGPAMTDGQKRARHAPNPLGLLSCGEGFE